MSSKLEMVKLYKTIECLKVIKIAYICVYGYTIVVQSLNRVGLFCDCMVCSSQAPLSVEFP